MLASWNMCRYLIYWELCVMVNTSVSEAEVIGSSPVFPTVCRIGGRLRKQSIYLSIKAFRKIILTNRKILLESAVKYHPPDLGLPSIGFGPLAYNQMIVSSTLTSPTNTIRSLCNSLTRTVTLLQVDIRNSRTI